MSTEQVTCRLTLSTTEPSSRSGLPRCTHWPATRPPAGFPTLLMSTGLTFGTISATYGLAAGIVDRAQFSVRVSVVVQSAVVPTAIARRFLAPPHTTLAATGGTVAADERRAHSGGAARRPPHSGGP